MSTIRQRLTRRLLLGWTLLLTAGGLLAYWTAWNALTRQFDGALHTKALALMSTIEQDGNRITVDADDPLLRDFDAGPGASSYEVLMPDGSLVARSLSLGDADLSGWHLMSPGPEFDNVRLANGARVRVVGLRFRPHPADDAKSEGAPREAVLFVASNRQGLDGTLATLALVLAGCGAVLLALTAVSVPWLLGREFAPLNHLADQAQRITADSLSARFPFEALPGELTPIAARLNDLLGRLQTSFERERRFSDDLAHEFRTPVAELRSLAELSLKWPETRNAEADRNVLAIALQMESIINRLLAIARSDQGHLVLERQRVPLAALAATCWKPLEARAGARQITLRMNVPAELAVHSDPVLLRSILTNLLDNAVEYSPPGGAVAIQGKIQDSQFILSVTNPVQHFGADELSHLFERFWRKDAARSGSEHSGLGLSLARAFATSLGCTLTASMNGDARLTMTLAGPSAFLPAGSDSQDTFAKQTTN